MASPGLPALLSVLLLLLLAFVALHPTATPFFPAPHALRPPSPPPKHYPAQQTAQKTGHNAETLNPLKVFVVDLPRELNYGLLEAYYHGRRGRARLWVGEEEETAWEKLGAMPGELLPYPKNPIWAQYSAEYWLLADLLTVVAQMGGDDSRAAVRVKAAEEAEVFFVPFFAALSAEVQLAEGHGRFRKKVEENRDFVRQRAVVESVMGTAAWRRSGGRDHVFTLTDPMAMWHVRSEIAPSILLVVDFGGWYMEDAKPHEKPKVCFEGADVIPHTQVSLTKDVVVPYTHLLPSLDPLELPPRDTLLYFKGARHRHRTGLVRDKLWGVLGDEPGVIMEEGFPNRTGREQALKGMRRSHFCLNPAGDTPTSSRLFDAIANLCIPVIVSDTIELPFEGILDYTTFAVFISVGDAMVPGVLLQRLRSMNATCRDALRARLAQVRHHFEYDNGFPGGRGPAVKDGAVSLIWRKVKDKVPSFRATITREQRKFRDAVFPARCLCT